MALRGQTQADELLNGVVVYWCSQQQRRWIGASADGPSTVG